MKKILYSGLIGAGLLFSLAACGEEEPVDDYKITVTAPFGAPAISVANCAVANEENYDFIGPTLIGETFTKGESDIIIAPVNAGAVQYKKTQKYQLGAVVTWCNIYIATQRTDINTINDLNGKEVTLFGENTINSSLVKAVFEGKNITPVYADSYESSADTAATTLISDEDAIVMTAEPFLANAVNTLASSNKNIKSFAIRDLYKELNDGADFAQAGLFVRKETVANHKAVVDNYLDAVKAGMEMLESDIDVSVNNIISLNINGLKYQAPVLKAALPGCAIKFVSATDAKDAVIKTANIDLSKFGGAIPSDDFYYSK